MAYRPGYFVDEFWIVLLLSEVEAKKMNALQRTNERRRQVTALQERLQAFSDALRDIQALNNNKPGQQVRASIPKFKGTQYLHAAENISDADTAYVVGLAKIRQAITQTERLVLRQVELADRVDRKGKDKK